MIKLFLLIFISINYSFANERCEVLLEDNIIVFKKSFIKEATNCNQKQKDSINQFLTTLKGTVHSTIIEQQFQDIIIKNEKITLLDSKRFISKLLKLDNNKRIGSFKIIPTPKKNLSITKAQILDDNRLFPTRSFRILFENRVYTFEAKIEQRISSLVALKDLHPYSKNNLTAAFKLQSNFSAFPEKNFREINDLEFYKINKTIRPGHVLTTDDLVAKYLVNSGNIVEVTLVNESFNLSSRAQARKSGKIGDVIPLVNQKTKKTIYGKIIGFNRVRIDL